MCIFIWVNKDKFEREQNRISQNRFERLRSKIFKKKQVRFETEQDLGIKVNHNHFQASQTSDSVSPPRYI